VKPGTLRFLLVVGCAACFGTGLTVSRLGLRQFDAIGYTGLRFGAAATAFAVFLIARRRASWPRDLRFWTMAVLFGVVGTALPMLAIISSLQYLSSGTAAIVAAVGPSFAVVFAHFALRDERLSVRKIQGVIVACAGAAYLIVQKQTGLDVQTSQGLGYGLLLGGLALSYGAIVTARRYLRGYDLFQVVGVQMVTAAAVLLPLALARFSAARITDVTIAAITVVYGGAIGTFAAFLGRFALIKQFGATDAALIDYVVPVMATGGGLVILDERLTVTMVIGMVIILLGVRIVQSATHKVSIHNEIHRHQSR
jgi:drug/metabolite transporter (DMT)-like permease